MIKVTKRDSREVDFDRNKIITAIESAMRETKLGIDAELSEDIADDIEANFEDYDIIITVEDIQNLVEDSLMKSDRPDVAKRYIIKRYEKQKIRDRQKYAGPVPRLLSDEFISSYKHKPDPFKEVMGAFVYYRTYSRYLEAEHRREYWWETVRRAVEYNCSLVQTTREEAEKLFDNVYNLRQFLSGRTFWVGGTDVAYKYPLANFNCAFTVIDNFNAYKDLFYLLMVGSGVGIRVLRSDVAKLPKVRTNVEVIHRAYEPVLVSDREDITSIEFLKDTAYIKVGDSKEGKL